MKRISYLLLLVFILTACNPLLQFRPYTRDFTFRTYKPYPGIDSILNVDGYFINRHTPDSFPTPDNPDSMLTKPGEGNYVVMFYRDGTCATLLMSEPDINTLLTDENQKKRKYLGWGRYYINGDTIKSQQVIRENRFRNVIYEYHYLIESRNKIRMIRLIDYRYINSIKLSHPFGVVPRSQRYNQDVETVDEELYFVPFTQRIDSTSWVKGKSWYWE